MRKARSALSFSSWLLLLAVPGGPLLAAAGQDAGPDRDSTPGSPVTVAAAHTGGEALRVQSRNARSDPGFLFGRPGFTISGRMGFLIPRGESQFHDFAIDRLTLERGDFRSFTGGVEGGVWLSDRTELTVGLDGASVTTDSEYREFVEPTPQGDELPIRQTTRVAQGPTFTAGLKYYPLARGESLSRFAWVPNPASPFLSAGAGGTRYQLEQWGDFVIEETLDIITEEYRAEGAGFVGFLGGGVDVNLATRVALVLEGRYFWGEARMTDDFRQFGPLDLAGLRLTAGLAYRF